MYMTQECFMHNVPAAIESAFYEMDTECLEVQLKRLLRQRSVTAATAWAAAVGRGRGTVTPTIAAPAREKRAAATAADTNPEPPFSPSHCHPPPSLVKADHSLSPRNGRCKSSGGREANTPHSPGLKADTSQSPNGGSRNCSRSNGRAAKTPNGGSSGDIPRKKLADVASTKVGGATAVVAIVVKKTEVGMVRSGLLGPGSGHSVCFVWWLISFFFLLPVVCLFAWLVGWILL